jgi:serine/threonine-protein kinase
LTVGDGTAFGRYRLLRLLGEGGMGQVHLAHDTETDRMVALKVLRAEFAADPGFNERFRREAYAAARLHEPHVVPIHNFGEIDGRLYVDMRLIEGRDLGALIRENPRGMDVRRAVTIVEQIASALDAAHRAGLVHRDVKPSNIIVGERDFAYLIDFGIVQATESAALTATGTTLGTVAYMAPEQFMSGHVDARSDIYSLACVLFECVTGRQPFSGDWRQIGMAHASAPPPRASSLNPGVPTHLEAVIAAGMAKEPANRYPNAVAFGQAAREALTTPQHTALWQPHQWQPTNPIGAPAEFAPQLRKPWWRRRGVAIGAAAALVAVLVASVVFAVLPETSTSAGDAPSADTGYGKVAILPFPLLRNETKSLAVDPRGTVFAGDFTRLQIMTSGAAKSNGIELGSDFEPFNLAARSNGDVYMTDTADKRVAMLRAGTTTPQDLPFGALSAPAGIAVDNSGTVYVADVMAGRVFTLAPGDSAPSEIPLRGLSMPVVLAIDSQNSLYVLGGYPAAVVKVAADGSSSVKVPGTPKDIVGMAVDSDDNLYVVATLEKRVSMLASGSSDWVDLPFTDLVRPSAVAVDEAGNVYVRDDGDIIVKLPKAR